MIVPAGTGHPNFMDLPDSLDDVELLAPFGGNASLDGEMIEGIGCSGANDALSR